MSASHPPKTGLRSKLVHLGERIEWNEAIFFTLLTRGWQFLAGPVTVLLVGLYFTRETQGFYYLFWNLLALQVFVEFQLHTVIMNVTSHEWAKLELTELGELTGEPRALSRLASFGQLLFKGYLGFAVLFLAVVGGGGTWFLSTQPTDLVDWPAAWWGVVLVNAILIWLIPFHALLEGCEQVATVRKMQFWQACTGNLALWVCIPLGLELWVIFVLSLVRLFWEIWSIFKWNAAFFKTFWKTFGSDSIDWWEEVWPLQWRIGVKGVFIFFAFQLFTPVMFAYHGAEVAGQMGMTWTVLMALQMAAAAWVQTRAPQFGVMVAQQQFVELDQLFRRLVTISVTLMALGGSIFVGVVWMLNWFDVPFAIRFLPVLPVALLTIAVVLSLIPNFQWVYIHAHKQSPHMWLSCLSSAAVGLLVWWLGKEYAATGAAAAYLGMVVCFSLPVWTWAWYRCRQAGFTALKREQEESTSS